MLLVGDEVMTMEEKQKKIRRRIEDALRKLDDEQLMLRIAALLKVKTD